MSAGEDKRQALVCLARESRGKPMPERVTWRVTENARAIRTKPKPKRPQPERGTGEEEAEAKATAESGSENKSERTHSRRTLRSGGKRTKSQDNALSKPEERGCPTGQNQVNSHNNIAGRELQSYGREASEPRKNSQEFLRGYVFITND